MPQRRAEPPQTPSPTHGECPGGQLRVELSIDPPELLLTRSEFDQIDTCNCFPSCARCEAIFETAARRTAR